MNRLSSGDHPAGEAEPDGTIAPPPDNLVPLSEIVRTEELSLRPARPPDYETENRALAALVQGLADSPGTILQRLADTLLQVFKADSAGLSLLTDDEKNFHWPAIAGAWRPHAGGGTPRDFGPCGDVLDRCAPMLFTHFERRYPYLLAATPPAEECLLVPFYVQGKAVGTIWAIAHDDRRKFDAEDLRQLESLGRFASAAYQAVESQNAIAERQVALGRMEDALQSGQAMEKINAALRESEQRYRTLFDLGPVAVYTCDAGGVIQQFNRRATELWGREPASGDTEERFCGSHKLYLVDGTFMPHEQCPMAKVVSGAIPEASDAEVLIERPDGSRVTVIVNIRPLKSPSGEITGAINCFYDITERSRLEKKTREQAEALVDQHRRKDEFLAMLGHELRNPLAPLANAVQLLRMQKNEDPLQQQAHGIIERQVGNLKHLVDDLLEVSRITTGRVQLRREQIVVSGIVERALETVQPLIVQRRHQLTVSLPPQPIWLHADAARLDQVLVNLLTNAAKYTDEGGHIWLSVQYEDDVVVLAVRDTGIGIAPELLPDIFDLFIQAERSLDRSQGGLGIGLSLVQRLVGLHGGSVAVHSVLGQGSEFVVRLPVMLTALPLPPSPADARGQAPGIACRVLVVDDNVDAAQILALLLKGSGHTVRTAHDGLGALEAALAWRPDVMLLDLGLPGVDGFEVARRIRQQPNLKHIVLVAVTGYGLDTDRQLSREAGFAHHLIKPVDFGAVKKILATSLGASEQAA